MMVLVQMGDFPFAPVSLVTEWDVPVFAVLVQPVPLGQLAV
jgi:hypothetical protein